MGRHRIERSLTSTGLLWYQRHLLRVPFHSTRCRVLTGWRRPFISFFSPLQKSFMWNTLSIQYSPLIEEEWDEHYKVTCEYGYDYWKTVSFPFLNVEWVFSLGFTPSSFRLSPKFGLVAEWRRATR